MIEAQLQQRVIKYARANGIFTRKLVAVNYRGFPDLFLAKNGRCLFLELKTPKRTGIVSALQKTTHEEMRRAGLLTAIVDTYDGAIAAIESALHVDAQPSDHRARKRDHAAI